MDAASNELNRPLGVAPARPRGRLAGLAPRRAGRYGAAALVAAGAAAVAYGLLFGDHRGGVPRGEAPIRLETAQVPPPARAEPPAASRDRAGAAEVEAASGVAVSRPAGAVAPTGIVIRVPDEMLTGLPRAPDPRVTEATRNGALPRIGAGGLRPLDVYRRPPAPAGAGVKRVAVVVGGLGISASATLDAIGRLPDAVTLAFAPYGTELETHVSRAREAGHEVLLQVPMEPFDYPDSDPGPHTLLTGPRSSANLDHLQWAMGRMPGYVGLMNYMGGKLTADERALAPLLREVGARGLGILDDGSSSRSRILALAGDVPAARAELVLDAVPRPDAIDRALERLEAAAGPGRVVVASASALPVTLDRIARWAKGLEARGILLVPVSAALVARAAAAEAER